jgi:hypothetical protein
MRVKLSINTFSAPKGRRNLAQGFNPGFDGFKRRALKGHQIWYEAWISKPQTFAKATLSGATFRAHAPGTLNPGLKPRLRKASVAASYSVMQGRKTRARRSEAKAAWAKFLCPFGAMGLLPSLSPLKFTRMRKLSGFGARTRYLSYRLYE